MSKDKPWDYHKMELFPNGMKCPNCGGSHFHPLATVLPNLTAVAPDPKGKDGKTHLWVARSECLGKGCRAFIDWTFHPDYTNGYGNEFISIVEWFGNPLHLNLYKDYPRSRK